ncbi:hypothetical protein TNIN_426471 [Trichonephila inaurata madagascariensis]|uniref:Uncharacterized protein n=1 Tax=Trichonephila inaurata madagascariensis TaxID=2747483 RepID=A0A8X6IR59_9ARAC|nr:hypothetical protein TNIN_426471 [Trichonephila inaurata madagascariensis]
MTQDVLDCRHDLKNLASFVKTIVPQWDPAPWSSQKREKMTSRQKGVLVHGEISRPKSPFFQLKILLKDPKKNAQKPLPSPKSWGEGILNLLIPKG